MAKLSALASRPAALSGRRRILFLSRWHPFPPDNGSKLRVHSLLAGLAEHYQVRLICFDDRPDTGGADGAAAPCDAVYAVRHKPFDPASLRARMGFFSTRPRYLVDTYSPAMAECIGKVAADWRPDLVIASETDMALYQPSFGDTPALCEDVEVGVYQQRYALATPGRHKWRQALTWWKHRRWLAQLLPRFAQLTVVSEVEARLLRTFLPAGAPIQIIPNCVWRAEYEAIRAVPQPNTLVFSGSFRYAPNHEAMCWFLEAVFPRVKAEMPATRLLITGDPANRTLPPVADVTLAGHLPDVRPIVAGANASVVPIRSGGGTRLKILEAMALGTPVVATQKGAEGLAVESGTNILLADDPEQFAQHVVCVLREPGLRRHLAAGADELVRREYDWAVVMPRFIDLVAAAMNGAR
jgi:glycosyltransferase involved in cell wall biosynthesis